MPGTKRSAEFFRRSSEIIPGGVNSPVRAFKAVGGIPRVIKSAEGAFLTDVDGNRYIDFCMSWGPLILGHAHPKVVEAISNQARLGTSYGATTELEYRLARKTVDNVPSVDKVRFVSSGTEAVMSAVRLARGFTGRDLILKFEGCYHGHADHLLVKAGSGLATLGTPSSAGVPESFASQTAVLPLDDLSALETFFSREGDRLAAAIIEGIPANSGLLVQSHEFMHKLQALTSQHGALFILDEVITGFRLGWGGAAGYYGLKPDLMTFGKVIGGGLPVGALGGRADIMDYLAPDGPVYQAGTLSGNPIAMAAGLATLEVIEHEGIYDRLEKATGRLVTRLKEGVKSESFSVISAGSIFWILHQRNIPKSAGQISESAVDRFNSLHSHILDAGVYLPPSAYEVCFVSSAHTDELLDQAVEALVKQINAHPAKV